MSATAYLAGIDAVTGRLPARITTVLGEATPAALTTCPPWLRQIEAYEARSSSTEIPDSWPTLAGAGVGALLWSDHRVLGAIGGASLARNIPALAKSDLRSTAAANLGQTGAAVLGAMVTPGVPYVGFLLTYLAIGALRQRQLLRELWAERNV